MAEYAAYGTTFAIGDSSVIGSANFTNVVQVRNISGPGFSLDTADVTAHDSTGAWEEHVPTILRSGEVTFELVWDPDSATHESTSGGLVHAMTNRTLLAYRIQWPDSTPTEWKFQAYVAGFEPTAPHDDALTASVTLKLTGAPTLG